jgi:hypothetical protein
LYILWHRYFIFFQDYGFYLRKKKANKLDENDELFSIYLILLATLGPGVYSASDRKEYQKHKNYVSGE